MALAWDGGENKTSGEVEDVRKIKDAICRQR
jgi:hypothetical protein